jgi:hypothetical protein
LAGRDTIDALLPLIMGKSDSAHLDLMTAHYKRARRRLDKLADDRRNASPLHPQYVAATIDRLAAANAIFTADVGTPCIWAARYLHMNGTRRLIGSFNHGSMDNALPQAIGAQASRAAGGVRARRAGPGRRPHGPAGARPAAQAHLRPDQGLHSVHDENDPVRRRRRAGRARQDEPARAGGRMTRADPG